MRGLPHVAVVVTAVVYVAVVAAAKNNRRWVAMAVVAVASVPHGVAGLWPSLLPFFFAFGSLLWCV
jgi:hypothetical protein